MEEPRTNTAGRLFACALLGIAVVTILLYLNALSNDFVNWDDYKYVVNNEIVKRFNVRGIFSAYVVSNYHPLTLLSYATEYSLIKLDPFYYHLTNVVLHAANSVLVALFIYRISGGNLFVSVFSSLLFAVHPLHVESVAWISERKDVLSALFYLLALVLYAAYKSRAPKGLALNGPSALIFLFFVLSLLSKPMAITLPLVLLVCDYKLRGSIRGGALREKLPFLIVSALFLAVALHAQSGTPLFGRAEALTPGNALGNGFRGLVFYLFKSVVPTGLSVLYPEEAVSISPAGYLVSLGIAGAVLSFFLLRRERRKDIVLGLLFFFITIFPVLKVFPFGTESLYNDRYMYFPSIGLFYIYALIVYDLFRVRIGRLRAYRAALGALVIGLLAVYCVLTFQRNRVWRNSESLWRDVLEKYPGATIAHFNLGIYYQNEGSLDKAAAEFNRTLRRGSRYDAHARVNLASIYSKKGRLDEAEAEFQRAIAAAPNREFPYAKLGELYMKRGAYRKAVSVFTRGVESNPGSAALRSNLGNALLEAGRLEDAAVAFEGVLELDPESSEALIKLVHIYYREKEFGRAVDYADRALAKGAQIDGRFLDRLRSLGRNRE